MFGAPLDEERKEYDASAKYACNEWRQRRYPLGFCESPHPVHEGRFAADQNEPERQISYAVLFYVADFLLGVVENRPFRSLTRSLTVIGELAALTTLLFTSTIP